MVDIKKDYFDEIYNRQAEFIQKGIKAPNILDILSDLGLPYALIAKTLGIQRSSASSYVVGVRDVPLEYAEPLMELLGVALLSAEKIASEVKKHLWEDGDLYRVSRVIPSAAHAPWVKQAYARCMGSNLERNYKKFTDAIQRGKDLYALYESNKSEGGDNSLNDHS